MTTKVKPTVEKWREMGTEKLKSEFVVWRKNYLKQYLVSGYQTPGGDGPDNTYLIWYWFFDKLSLSVQEAKAEEATRIFNTIEPALNDFGKSAIVLMKHGMHKSGIEMSENVDFIRKTLLSTLAYLKQKEVRDEK